jgi:hypothetical protein
LLAVIEVCGAVLRETVHVNVGTDVEAAVAGLRARCAEAGLAPALTDLLLTETREVLSSFVEQGKRIAAVGSQMEATRDITGDGYFIRLIFREGVRRSFIQRLLDGLRGA